MLFEMDWGLISGELLGVIHDALPGGSLNSPPVAPDRELSY
jgi:hypothetical protein